MTGELKQDFVVNIIALQNFLLLVTIAETLWIRFMLLGADSFIHALKWVLLMLVGAAIDAYPVKGTRSWRIHILRFLLIVGILLVSLILIRDTLLDILVVWLILCGYC